MISSVQNALFYLCGFDESLTRFMLVQIKFWDWVIEFRTPFWTKYERTRHLRVDEALELGRVVMVVEFTYEGCFSG